ncbi:serine/threonine-protein kinase ULK3 [Culicoides brevitarsis]|uniref:serine/threonine-protein kinase ULK3 n=1 Tax=Culicoides brevitarsis TaxID=469753 RepID=UPI00307C8CC0
MAIPDASIHDYEFHEKLGAGTYATVYRATKTLTGEVCAIKCIERSKLSCQAAEDNIITEIQLLKTLKHKHIVEMKDFLWDKKQIYIITEYCNGGDLSSYIKRRHSLPESICKTFLRQLALAMQYMRAHDVSHFDLKPQNLLLCREPGRYVLKIADFGFAQHLKLGQENHTIKGSLLYMAPEILLRESYDHTADLWSIGVIFYECLFGRAPYRSATVQELLEKVRSRQKIEFPAHTKISNECEHLLKQLLRHNPQQRISFEDFFAHDFIDLKHFPSEETLKKSIEIFTRAVSEDKDGKLQEAYDSYCEGLKYLTPIVNEEPNASKRQALRQQANAYVKRAEEIRKFLKSSSGLQNIETPQESVTVHQAPQISRMNSVDNVLDPGIRFQTLYTSSKSSPAICHALDIGRQAELYAHEKNFTTALQSFQSALGSLVPLLQKEPKGPRRDMLHSQIMEWMDAAENIKAYLEPKDESGANSSLDDDHHACVLQ